MVVSGFSIGGLNAQTARAADTDVLTEVLTADQIKLRENLPEKASNIKVTDQETRDQAWIRYEKYWAQIAERFEGYSDHLIFEGANEELGDRLNDAICVNGDAKGYAKPDNSGKDIKTVTGNLTTNECYETLALPTQSVEITFTITGLSNVLSDIADETYVNPQTGRQLNGKKAGSGNDTKPADPTPSASATAAPTKPATPGGITTPAAIKKIGLKVNKTFTAGNYKYKVTKRATTASQGAVKVVGFTKKGAKAKKLKTLTLKAKLKKVSKGAFKGYKKIKVKGGSAKVRKANVKLLKKSGYKKFR